MSFDMTEIIIINIIFNLDPYTLQTGPLKCLRTFINTVQPVCQLFLLSLLEKKKKKITWSHIECTN